MRHWLKIDSGVNVDRDNVMAKHIMMKFQGDEASIIILRALKEKVMGMANDIDK